jgi:hypothetical protein
MRHIRLSLALVPLLAASAFAQRAGESRRGFYVSFGVGYGMASVTQCSGCGSTTLSGYSGYLAAGGTLSPHWRLGFEGSLWQQPSSSGAAHQNLYAAAIAFYPNQFSPWWIKGLAGYSYLSPGFNSSGASWSGPGGGFTVGLGTGYDWDEAFGNVAVLPYFNIMRQMTPTTSGLPIVFEFGVGMGIRH